MNSELMFNNNPIFTVMGDSIRCMVISKALEKKMSSNIKLPEIHIRDNDYNWTIFKVNVVLLLPQIWIDLLTNDQLIVIEQNIMQYIRYHYGTNITASHIAKLKEHIKGRLL